MKKAVKGEYGYLRKRRVQSALFTFFSFAVSLALFFAGIIATGTKRNLLTIVAVLGLLPASKSAVNLIMLCRARGCTEELRDRLTEVSGGLRLLYDMYFTSYSKNFAIYCMTVCGGAIVGYTGDEACDLRACTEHITQMLSQAGLKAGAVTIVNDLAKFTGMLRLLSEKNGTEQTVREKDEEIIRTLFEIIL